MHCDGLLRMRAHVLMTYALHVQLHSGGDSRATWSLAVGFLREGDAKKRKNSLGASLRETLARTGPNKVEEEGGGGL